MPITPLCPIHRIAQDDFQQIAYTVMGHVFEIHSEYVRFFNECIYKQELASRMPGGADRVVRRVDVRGSRQIIGRQSMHFAGDEIVFKLTAFKSPPKSYEDHLRRLLRHIDVRSMLWINIDLKHVTFTLIQEKKVID
jgi:hypothetical protein